MKRPPGTAMLDRARALRRAMTPQEAILWRQLRDRRLDGFKFRKQMWLCGFIADFACPEGKLVVEADGSQHADNEAYDGQRAAVFAREGYRTIRFWNNEIVRDLEGVLIAIRATLPSPSHPALPGEPIPLPKLGEGK
jgi:very-short-patch-repair endonuclease